MPEDVKFSISLPDGRQTEWDQKQYNKAAQSLFEKYPDAQVNRISGYSDQSELTPDSSFHITLDDGRETDWNYDQFSKAGKNLMEKYPGAKISVSDDITARRNRDFAHQYEFAQSKVDDANLPDEEKQQYIDFVGQNADRYGKVKDRYGNQPSSRPEGADRLIDIYSRIEALENELDTLPEERDYRGLSRAEAIQYAQEANSPEGRRRSEIKKELEQLRKERENNPAWIAYWNKTKEELPSLIDAMDAKAKENANISGRSANMSDQEALDLIGGAEERQGNEQEQDYYLTARKYYKEALETAKAPSKYDDSWGLVNFAKGVGANITSAVSILELAKSLQDVNLINTVKQIQQAEGKDVNLINLINNDSDKLNYLSDGQKEMLKAFAKRFEVEQGRSDNMSIGYNAGKGAVQSLGFMGDFLITGGVGSAAAKSLLKTTAKEMAGKTLSEAGKKMLVGGLEGATKALVMTPLMPSSYANFINTMTQLNGEGQMDLSAKAVRKAIEDGLIETFSENAGELFGIPFETKIFDGIAKSKLGEIGKAMSRTGAGRLLKDAGWHGLIGEMAEEVLGNAMRSIPEVGTDPEALKNFFSGDEFWTTLASFAPMSIIGAGASGYQIRKAGKQMSKYGDQLKTILNNLGLDEERMEDVEDSLRAISNNGNELMKTPAELGSEIAKIGKMVGDTGLLTNDIAPDLGMAMGQYLQSAAQYKVLRGIFDEEQDIARAQNTALLDEQVGNKSWYHEGENGANYVRTITDAEGNERFVVNSLDGQYALIGKDGSYSFLTNEELEAGIADGSLTDSGEQPINDYLDGISENDQRAAEEQRMAEETSSQITAIQERIAADPTINMGTEEAPKMAVVDAANANGVHVTWQDEDGAKDATLTWEQVGNYLGTPVEVKTDEQIEQEEIQAEDDIRSRKEDYNKTIPEGTEFNAVLVEGEEPVTYQFKRAFLNEDGTMMLQVTDKETGKDEQITEEMALQGNLTSVLDSLKTPEETQAEEVQTEEEAPIEEDNTLRDFRGNPIPLKDDGSVNQTALWNADPEAWARWNDSQRNDGGANSRGYIAKATKKLQSDAKAVQKQIDSELDFDRISELEGQLGQINSRIADLERIENNYANAEVAQTEAVETPAEAPAPVAETTEAAPVAEAAQTQGEVEAAPEVQEEVAPQTPEQALESRLAEAKTPEEKRQALEEYYALTTTDPTVVGTRADILQRMAELGFSERVIGQVRDQLNAEGTLTEGFHIGNTVFIVADDIRDARRARLAHLHEHWHEVNRQNGYQKVVASIPGATTEYLLAAANKMAGVSDKNGYGDYLDYPNPQQALADEVIALSMEVVAESTPENVDENLRNAGLDNQEIINFVKTIYNGERGNDQTLDSSGRDTLSGDNAQEGERQDGGDSASQPEGNLGEQGSGSGEGSDQGTEGAGEQVTPTLSPAQQEKGTNFVIEDGKLTSYMDAPTGQESPSAPDETMFSLRREEDSVDGEGKPVPGLRTLADGFLAKLADKPLTPEELAIGSDAIGEMVNYMMPYLDKVKDGKRYLPEEIFGKGWSTIFKNGSYGRTMENTLICMRTLAYNDFVNAVQEKVGRPLTPTESFLASQMLYDIATDPQCLYCYVALDRKAYNGFLKTYIEQRDAVLDKYKADDSIDKTYRLPAQAKSRKNRKALSADNQVNKLYLEYLDGRADTPSMRNRFNGWLDRIAEGTLIGMKDLTSPETRQKVAGKGASYAAQIDDAEKYAQSASWAKKQEEYRAYNGELLSMPQKVVNLLNSEYGLRFYSFSEYSPAFIVENMQMVRDAALRGLVGLAYTKEIDFAKIFAPTGININISCYGREAEDGTVVMDTKQGADWGEAQALRERYGNVGCVFVATNDRMVEWAIHQPWVDVVIPFHIVRTGEDIAKFYDWTNYTAMEADKDVKGRSRDIMPTEHMNDKDTFLRLCEERGLKPRFADLILPSTGRSVTEDPDYMKLVNETRRSVNETVRIKPIFDIQEARRSFDEFVDKGGYYAGWFTEEGAFERGVEQVAADVEAGKTAKDVDYGRQDIKASAEKLAAMAGKKKRPRTHQGTPRRIGGDKITKAQQSVLNYLETGEFKSEREPLEVANATQKQPASEAAEPVVTEEDVMFRLSKNNKATVESWLKKREDLNDEQRAEVVDYIDKLDDAKTQLATAKWFANGTIRIPEDMKKVQQAISVAGKAKVDPLRYNSPMELLDAHAEFKPSEERINPDEVSTLHRAAEYPDGIVVYDVDNTKESRENMRKIINTHFGEDASPWCLLQGDGKGNLTEQSAKYWKHYNAYPKQVAFKDGKLLAFSANDTHTRVWWDRQDQSHYGIPLTKKVEGDELGRSADYIVDEGGKLIIEPGGHMYRGNRQNGVYEEWNSDGSQLLSRIEYKDGKEEGISEEWYPSGQIRRRAVLKEDRYVGTYEQWYDNGQQKVKAEMNEEGDRDGEQVGWYRNGNKSYEWRAKEGKTVGDHIQYYETGEPKFIQHFDEEGTLAGYEDYVSWRAEKGIKAHIGIGRRVTYLPLDSNGKEKRVEEEFRANGKLHKREEYHGSKLDGTVEYYYPDGTIQTRTHYVEGERNGMKEVYHENGKLWLRGDFKDGEVDGLQEQWNKEGDLILREEWKDGQKVRTLPLDENVQFRKVEPIVDEKSEELFERAKKTFGVTKNLSEAGYVIPDGSMLDFSGRHLVDPNKDSSWLNGGRTVDHRDISDLNYEKDLNTPSGYETDMSDFIRRGAIRLNSGVINLATKPTSGQENVLWTLIQRANGDVDVDFGDGYDSDHYASYNHARPERVINDIRRYFDEGIEPEGNVMFRKANQTQNGFISNAEMALDKIKMEKATPEQWRKMLEKEGGLKAGEDKWLGLSDWLKESDKKTLTKDEIGDFIEQNRIQIEEQHYSEEAILGAERAASEALQRYQDEFDTFADEWRNGDVENSYYWASAPEYAFEQMVEKYGDDFRLAFEVDGHTLAPMQEYDEEFNDATKYFLGLDGAEVRPIDSVRLDYTTPGLSNKAEIALTVPTIDPWNEGDKIHFGDAGEGRAVAWIRFGDATSVEAGEQGEEQSNEKELTPEQRERLDSLEKRVREAGLSAQASTNQEELDLAEAALREAIAERDAYKEELGLNERPVRTTPQGRRSRVLVIDEIQSKRHQEARERGGYTDENTSLVKKARDKAEKEWEDYSKELRDKYNLKDDISYVLMQKIYNKATPEEFQKAAKLNQAVNTTQEEWRKVRDRVPAAPFEKNWHELAMKRMLRLAAEEGYDKIAWTTGDQQAERYNLGGVVNKIESTPYKSEGYNVDIVLNKGDVLLFNTDKEGTILSDNSRDDQYVGKNLSDVVGKDIAKRILDSTEEQTISGDGLRVGGEGMNGFYDDILPRFMNKYGKKWGVKVQDVALSEVYDETGRPLVMHSVDVTPEMKESVMEGQTMFRKGQITLEQDKEYMDAVNAGDMDKAQQMVREAAALAMPDTKVVDEDGKPKVVYHGSYKKGITKFNDEHKWSDSPRGTYWFTNIKAHAETYQQDGGDLLNVFLNIKNPLIIDAEGMSWDQLPAYYEVYSDKDGVEIDEQFDTYAEALVFTKEKGISEKSIIAQGEMDTNAWAKRAKEKGYDGLIVKRVSDIYDTLGENVSREDEIADDYVVFAPNQIKSAEPVTYDDNGNVIPLSERFNEESDDIRFSLRGIIGAENAEDEAALDNLEVAEEMENAGKDSQTIWRATGWERGADGKWRNEIPDAKQKEGVSLQKHNIASEVLDAPELFASYPQLAEIPIDLANTVAAGAYSAEKNRIVLDTDYNTKESDGQRQLTKEGIRTILHELQHAIQHIEGFAKGTNAKQGERLYYRDALKSKPEETYFAWFFSRKNSARKLNQVGRSKVIRFAENYDQSNLTEQDKEYFRNLINYLKGISDDEFKKFVSRAAKVVKTAEKAGEKSYENSAGEVEARNVERRSTLSDEKRQKYSPEVTEEYSRSEQIVQFRKVTDPATLERLESEPTIKVYRAMQEIDGQLYPPMAAKVEGKMQEPIELGVWEEAVERPDLADAKGNFTLNKGNGKSLKARYNPYIHTSRSPLNDQFTSAYDRPNLVTVEVEVPESELTSGYKAEKAKDSVGEMTWHAGPVSSKLPEEKKRKVILSRWDKPIRIVPDSEVADRIAELLEGEDIAVPYNTVTPSLREELENRGVQISDTPSGKVKETEAKEDVLFRRSQNLFNESREGGLTRVIGDENATELYHNVYRAIPKEIRERIVDRAGDGFLFSEATQNAIAEAVEKGDETGIAGLAANMLRDYVGDLDERTARYILWRGDRKVEDDDLLDTVNDIAMQRRLQVGEFADPVRFRLADDIEEAENRAESMADDAKQTKDENKAAAREDNALTTIKAMSLQKEYDKKTVNTITVLAKNIIKDQNIDTLNRREIARLLGIVTTSVGKAPKTVKKNADALVGLIVDHLMRSEETKLGMLANRKATKTNQAGVEVQGELDVRGQNILRAYKAGLDMDIENPDDEFDGNTIKGRLSTLSERLSSTDDAVRSEAEDEYAGLMLAQEYQENIKASINEERGLKNEMKEAAEAYRDGNISRTGYNQFVEEAEKSLRENKIDRIEAYRNLRAKMLDMMAGSVEARKEFTEREKQRVEEIHHLANSDMQGRSASSFQESTRMGRLANSSIVRFFAKPLATFDQMLRLFGEKNVAGEGYLFNKFHRGWLDAQENAYLGEKQAKEELDAKVSEVFDKKMRWSDLYEEERKMPTVKVKWWDGGEMKEHDLTQGNLLYIYMVNKMTDGRMKLRRMGITEETVDAIKRQMDSRFIELADWLQDEYLVNKRNKYNAVHERLFGASMAAIEDYFPLKINKRSLNRAEDIGRPEFDDALPATTTGSIIKRRRNAQDLDLLGADAFSVVIEHVEQMEQWAAFAEFNKDLNTLLSYKRFRNQVQNMATVYGSGSELWRNFKAVCRVAGGTYNPAGKKSDLDTAALNIAKGVTAAKISFRVYTALKQFLSMPAFVSDANIKYLGENMATPWKAWNWAMENLPLFEKRWKSRQAGDTRLMKTESDWKLWRNKIVEKASQWGMSPNAFVDALTVSIGAHSIYQSRYDRYIKDGYTEAQADKKAKQDATTLYNETQQSNEAAFTSPVQLDRTVLATMLTVFRNSSMGYQRQLHDAIRNIGKMMKPGYKAASIEFMTKQMVRDGLTEEQAEHAANRNYEREKWRSAARVATFGFLVQFAWNLGGSIAYLLFGDDDDKKDEMLTEALIHGLIGGTIEGLAGGNVMSEALNMVAKGESLNNYDPSLLPIISDMKSAYKKMSYDPVAGANDLINLAIQAGIGVNPQTLTDAVVAVVDACGGDLDTSKEAMLLIMRVLQVPQSQVDEIYIDELGENAASAKRMSVSEMAERYARYKVAKGAPITGWAYSDEAEEKREKAYLKRFKKLVKERKSK